MINFIYSAMLNKVTKYLRRRIKLDNVDFGVKVVIVLIYLAMVLFSLQSKDSESDLWTPNTRIIKFKILGHLPNSSNEQIVGSTSPQLG